MSNNFTLTLTMVLPYKNQHQKLAKVDVHDCITKTKSIKSNKTFFLSACRVKKELILKKDIKKKLKISKLDPLKLDNTIIIHDNSVLL